MFAFLVFVQCIDDVHVCRRIEIVPYLYIEKYKNIYLDMCQRHDGEASAINNKTKKKHLAIYICT